MAKRQPFSDSKKEAVRSKFNGHCAYCGTKPEKLQIDHLRPLAGGGTNNIDNLLPACAQCNNYKGALLLEDFRANMAEQVERARRYSVNFRLAERFGQITVHQTPIKFYFEKVEAK